MGIIALKRWDFELIKVQHSFHRTNGNGFEKRKDRN